MRHFLLTILVLLASSPALAQVYADPNSSSDSHSDSSAPASVGTPGSVYDHYYLNNGSNSNTVQVGRPYYYYPYYNGYPGQGYGSGSDTNDPNYFPGVAAPGPNTGGTKNTAVHHKSKKSAVPKVDTTSEY